MPGVAASYFLAKRDAHTDHDRQHHGHTDHDRRHYDQPDREHLHHGHPDRERRAIAESEHGSLALGEYYECQLHYVSEGIDVGHDEHRHGHHDADENLPRDCPGFHRSAQRGPDGHLVRDANSDGDDSQSDGQQ